MTSKKRQPVERVSSFVREAVKFSPMLEAPLGKLHSSLEDFFFRKGTNGKSNYLQGSGTFGQDKVEIRLNNLKSDTIAEVKHPHGYFYLLHGRNGLVYHMSKNENARETVTPFEMHMIYLLNRNGFENIEAANARAETTERGGKHFLSDTEFNDTNRAQVRAIKHIQEMAEERRSLGIHEVFSNITPDLTIIRTVEHRDGFKVIGYFKANSSNMCVFEFNKNEVGASHLRISRSLEDTNVDNFKRHSGIYVSRNGTFEFTHLDEDEFKQDHIYRLIKDRLRSAGVTEL